MRVDKPLRRAVLSPPELATVLRGLLDTDRKQVTDRIKAMNVGAQCMSKACGYRQSRLRGSDVSGNNRPNNTPQAYPAACCRDAQTGGFILFGARHAL